MSTVDAAIHKLYTENSKSYWCSRILGQLGYAVKISKVNGGKYAELLEAAVDFISRKHAEEGAITKETALQAEDMIAALSSEAKKLHMICVSHAHIDMNWLWGWDETVAITLDTFRTMLDLMNEYSGFTFSQSQAAVYRIVADFAPDMLREIKERVAEGRWEVTASHWVEADKNLPNGESLSRQILYSKRYLSELLGIDPDRLNLDFEPDTFGHSANVPEILANAGIKYYYHCRGHEGEFIYKWVAPSGKSVLVYKEPISYSAEIDSTMAWYAPEFCGKYGMDSMLKVYGVGDHGGGPTRRDLERIMDMNTWPVYPEIRFGTYAEFYRLVEKAADRLPVITGELNFMFTGCYTSQSRIKKANRVGEAALNEAEAFGAVSALHTTFEYPAHELSEAWKNILFNQFHDILPGSGKPETREHAMGLFQQTMAVANSKKSLALKAIAARIDTSSYTSPEEDIRESVSQGAGVGFGSREFKLTHVERGSCKRRIFHVFNPSPRERAEAVEMTVWDWQGNIDSMVFEDDLGRVVEHQLLDSGFHYYWGHNYVRVLVKVTVPAYGYSTFTMTEKAYELPTPFPQGPRIEYEDEFILENDRIKVVFNSGNASIRSFMDKASGEELIDFTRPAGVFRMIEEDTDKGMSAWFLGRHMQAVNIAENVKIKKGEKGPLHQSILFEMTMKSSRLKVTVFLEVGSSRLEYQVESHWLEVGRKEASIPQLGFHLPFGYAAGSYQYDVPMGTIVREPMAMDVPGNSWMLGIRSEAGKPSLMLVTDSKYGFRGYDNALNATLIRSSYEPDPYPELGVHKFRFAVCVANTGSNNEPIEIAYDYNHPFSIISGTPHQGDLPAAHSFVQLISGNFALSAIKMPEASDPSGIRKLFIRGYETEGKHTKADLRFAIAPSAAYFVDLNENRQEASDLIAVEGDHVAFDVSANSMASVCVEF